MRPPTLKLCPLCGQMLPRHQFPRQGPLCRSCKQDHRSSWATSLHRRLLAHAKRSQADLRQVNSRLIAAVGHCQTYKCFLSGLPLSLATDTHPDWPALVRVQTSEDWKPGNIILIAQAWAPVYTRYPDLATFRSCVRIASAPMDMAVPSAGQLLQFIAPKNRLRYKTRKREASQ